jgi:hypothetical protein
MSDTLVFLICPGMAVGTIDKLNQGLVDPMDMCHLQNSAQLHYRNGPEFPSVVHCYLEQNNISK